MPDAIVVGSVTGAVVAGLRGKGGLAERTSVAVIAACVGYTLGPEIQKYLNSYFSTNFDLIAACFIAAVFSNDVLAIFTSLFNQITKRADWK